ncbi:MAG: glucose-1-phosphate thymidylyltransferase [Cyanobacteria bacterium P01_H01_bin.15]
MKALILSGGQGTRLRPLTYTGAKQLVPVANQPILWYGIASLVKCGITEIGIVISPETGAEVQTVTGNGDRFGANITYILQKKPAGLAHAVKIAQDFLENSSFVMYLGDNLIQDDLQDFLTDFHEQTADALLLLCPVPDARAFGVVDLDTTGRIKAVVEKPKNPPSNLALVGVYFFSPAIHTAITTLKPSARGELEITDAIQTLINDQALVIGRPLEGWWLDTGKKDDLLEANHLVLDSYLTETQIDGNLDEQSLVRGRVKIGKGSILINSLVRGPVVIGENCRLENCFIGPHTSIGDQAQLTDVDLDHSVVLAEAKISHVQKRIADSLIGRRAEVCTIAKRPKALRLMVGDDSRIELAGDKK